MPYQPIWDGQLTVIHNQNMPLVPDSIFKEEKNDLQKQLYFVNRYCIFEHQINISREQKELLESLNKNSFFTMHNPYTLQFGETYRAYLKILFYKGELLKDISKILETLHLFGKKCPYSVHEIMTSRNISLNGNISPLTYQQQHMQNPQHNPSLEFLILEQGKSFTDDCVL